MVSKWLFGRPKPKPHINGSYHEPKYCSRIEELEKEIKESERKIAEYQAIINSSPSDDLDNCDLDELQDRIDDLESRLDNCDYTSDRYNRIQDEIDRLQNRADIMEYRQDMQDDLDDLYEDLDDIHCDLDNDDECWLEKATDRSRSQS